jgi:hypothetical protein
MGQFYSPSRQTTKEAKEIKQKKEKRKKEMDRLAGPTRPHLTRRWASWAASHLIWSARHQIVDPSFLSVRSMRPARELFALLALASIGEATLGLSANWPDA